MKVLSNGGDDDDNNKWLHYPVALECMFGESQCSHIIIIQ